MMKVESVKEEWDIVLNEINTTKCDCGGELELVIQALCDNNGDLQFYDLMVCECKSCKKSKEFKFDISELPWVKEVHKRIR